MRFDDLTVPIAPPKPLNQTSVTTLKGVGPALAKKLAAIDIRTVQDMLFHLPSRYQDRTQILSIAELVAGQQALIEGDIRGARVAFGKRRSLVVTIDDGSARPITLRFFHFNAAQKNTLQVGERLRCYAEVRRGQQGFEMVHPEYTVLKDAFDEPEDSLTPIYPTTEGLHQLSLRKLTDQSLALLSKGAAVHDYLPEGLLHNENLPTLAQALLTLHRPANTEAIEALTSGEHPACARLAFEELLAHRLGMLQLRDLHRKLQAKPLRSKGDLRHKFLSQLPFQLTGAQQRVVTEVIEDIDNERPMLRLVQGDVGSGKTVVAAAAACEAVASGVQVALMAPTEILAEQHYKGFCQWFEPLGVRVGWLSGRLNAKERRDSQQLIASGEVRIAIGTHALFQVDAKFAELGLVIIDEQHRFGVDQRKALRDKGMQGLMPHQLVMTATPIPRTLAMTSCADLDYSAIDELPPGRKPITTVAISEKRRPEVVQRVAAAIAEGRQVYWVCTLIDESETLTAQAASDTAELLAEGLPDASVALVHGRLKPEQKDLVMSHFKSGAVDLLVATTVIEVGVDVPNASLMIIENPERLGLSQLHQLRGRVGRGEIASTCVLLYHSPLGHDARERLAAMRETQDGFVLAERDLALRGGGEVFGTRQTGLVGMRIADLVRDRAMMPSVVTAATRMRESYPEHVKALVVRWLGTRAQGYGSV